MLRPRANFYAKGERASPADTLLVIEVSDSSLRYDQGVKLPLYARSGIGEVWILDVQRRILTSYRDPSAAGYATETTHQPGDMIALALDPEIVVSLELFAA